MNFEGKQTSPIRLSVDQSKLFAVNTPDARLSVFDVSHPESPFLLHEIPVGVEPVSVAPRTADEVWVVNEVSDSISVVSLSARTVVDTIPCKDEPADAVPANKRGPRGLTLNANAQRLYVLNRLAKRVRSGSVVGLAVVGGSH